MFQQDYISYHIERLLGDLRRIKLVRTQRRTVYAEYEWFPVITFQGTTMRLPECVLTTEVAIDDTGKVIARIGHDGKWAQPVDAKDLSQQYVNWLLDEMAEGPGSMVA